MRSHWIKLRSAWNESLIISKLTSFLPQGERRLVLKYSILTVALFVPLLWAFLSVRNLYPVAAWNVMMAGGDLERGRSYCILRGDKVSGQTVAVAPILL